MPKNFSPHGKKPRFKQKQLIQIYRRLLKYFGHRNWWPARTPFEVMLGAILTQNTSWANVQRAIHNLKRVKALNAQKIAAMDLKKLQQLIRPSGYFRQKADRLKIFANFFLAPPIRGSIARMKKIEPARMREMLLAVKGIGPETADSILLYALGHPVFVVDAYTRRIFARLGMVPQKIDYEQLRKLFEQNLPRDSELFNDFHAQLVALGNQYCRKKPRCSSCPLAELEKCRTDS